MDNQEEMDRFLEKFTLSRLNMEEIKSMNNPITNIEIEAVMKNLPKHKSSGTEDFIWEFHQAFSEALMPILVKFFQKLEWKEHFLTNSTRPPKPWYKN